MSIDYHLIIIFARRKCICTMTYKMEHWNPGVNQVLFWNWIHIWIYLKKLGHVSLPTHLHSNWRPTWNKLKLDFIQRFFLLERVFARKSCSSREINAHTMVCPGPTHLRVPQMARTLTRSYKGMEWSGQRLQFNCMRQIWCAQITLKAEDTLLLSIKQRRLLVLSQDRDVLMWSDLKRSLQTAMERVSLLQDHIVGNEIIAPKIMNSIT